MKDTKIQPVLTIKRKKKSKTKIKIICKDANSNKGKEEIMFFSHGNTLNRVLKSDAIEGRYIFHAKGKMRFYLKTIGHTLEQITAVKKF